MKYLMEYWKTNKKYYWIILLVILILLSTSFKDYQNGIPQSINYIISTNTVELATESVKTQENTSIQGLTETTTSVTPTESKNVFLSAIQESSGEAIGTIVVYLIVIILVIAIICVVCMLQSKQPRLIIKINNEKEIKPEYSIYIHELFTVLSKINYCLDTIRYRLEFSESQLKYFGLYRLLPLSITDSQTESIKLTAGPLEISNFEKFVTRVLGNKLFELSITIMDKPQIDGSILIEYELLRNGIILYKSHSKVDENIWDEITDIACKIIWAISCRRPNKVNILYVEKPPEVNLMHGIYLLAQYLANYGNIKPLENAVKYFNIASIAGGEWKFQSGLLEAIALQLTQTNPKRTVEKFNELLFEYIMDKKRINILYYYLGQANFYLYERDKYIKAIEYFQKINPPWGKYYHLWLILPFLHSDNSKMKYCLFCLARVSMEVARAHLLIVANTREEKERIGECIRKNIYTLREEINNERKTLGLAYKDVEWRILNATVLLDLYYTLDFDEGITYARSASEIAPYALPIKANLASMLLRRAIDLSKSGIKLVETKDFIESEKIFNELLLTGWDPSFILYRLGTINRIQGKFEVAIQMLNESAKNEQRDVPLKNIAFQRLKAKRRDSSWMTFSQYKKDFV